MKVPAIILGPKTQLEAYRHQKNIEHQALIVAIDERIRINEWVSGGLNDGEAKKSRERNLVILIEMSTERLQAMEDRNPDLISWVVPEVPENGWECAFKLAASRRTSQEEERRGEVKRGGEGGVAGESEGGGIGGEGGVAGESEGGGIGGEGGEAGESEGYDV